MSRLDEFARRSAPTAELDQSMTTQVENAAEVVVSSTLPVVTASKATWGSIVATILGGLTAAPVANAVLPDHILADMDFWKYLVWTIVQAGLFFGLTFINVYMAPPNRVIPADKA